MMPPDFPGFIKKYRHLIEFIYDELDEDIPHPIIARELYSYVDEYGIDLPTAVEALIRKRGGRPQRAMIQRLVAGGVRTDVWDRDEPAPTFALDPLEADIVTALLELTDPVSLGKAMAKSEHEPEMVVEHLPHFRRKWLEVRKARWAQLFIMEPPEIVNAAAEGD
jgi:hypothetical protein